MQCQRHPYESAGASGSDYLRAGGGDALIVGKIGIASLWQGTTSDSPFIRRDGFYFLAALSQDRERTNRRSFSCMPFIRHARFMHVNDLHVVISWISSLTTPLSAA
jgi:hypothetical protein